MEIVAGLPLKYLRLESTSSPMNLSQVIIFRTSDPSKAAPSLEALQAAVYKQISQNKSLRQRLVESPFQLANPVWIDDPHMDIHYHVKQHLMEQTDVKTLPEQILRIAAQLAAHQFDRGSPLWRLHLTLAPIPGVFALICITHRALLCRLHQTLFDTIFPKSIDLAEEQGLEALTMHGGKTGSTSTSSFSWVPDALPSRNDLLKLAKSDWMTIPKQTKALSSLVLNRWAKRKIASAIVDKNHLPPNWISAPQSIFNQPAGKHRDLAFVELPAPTSRALLRAYKNFEIRDLVLALISRSLKTFLEAIDHHTKDELIALVQSNSLSLQASEWDKERELDNYQLFRLPTNTQDPLEQLQSILERRTTAREYQALFDKQTALGVVPSSVLSWFIRHYNKFGIHHFHKPICNLVISEQPATVGARYLNGFEKTEDASFASLLPNVCLHVSYWVTNNSACISFTTGSAALTATDLARAFEESVFYLESSLERRFSRPDV